MKIVCLDGHALNPGDLTWEPVARLGELTVHDRTPADQVAARAADAEIILTNKTPIDQTLAQLPRLRYIGVLATGYNVVNVQAARQRGIVVTNVPTYGTDSVAEMVFALLLELARRAGRHSALVAAGQWSRSDDFCFWQGRQIELAGKTIGVVGAGRIGRRVIELALAFRMNVLAFDVGATDLPSGARRVEIDELFARSDVVSLHVPLTPQTHHLVNADRLAAMKPTAMLINTSRGPIIDEAALREALEAGRIAGAGLDVLAAEPPPANHPLIGLDNCVVTPHIAWATFEARQRLMNIVAENIAAWQAGRPQNVVTG